ncbi:hypothetical protein D1007_37142 [Hordeum vulgare]|nr:hypothetical protein D1007_37142 [Hordeum vulgare]
MIEQPINTVCWNVRGLNCSDCRASVKTTFSNTSCHLVCLEETKLSTIDNFIVASIGGNRFRNFAQHPTSGTRGRILLLWDDNLIHVTDISISTYCLSAMVRIRASDSSFKITSVYAPSDNVHKDAFFAGLLTHKPPPGVAWLALGDSNQIYRARDKNR